MMFCWLHCYAATPARLWLFRNFDEEQPIMPEKTHIPLSAADVKRPRPYKTSEINIRLSIFATNEQYHQMCGRAKVMQPLVSVSAAKLSRHHLRPNSPPCAIQSGHRKRRVEASSYPIVVEKHSPRRRFRLEQRNRPITRTRLVNGPPRKREGKVRMRDDLHQCVRPSDGESVLLGVA